MKIKTLIKTIGLITVISIVVFYIKRELKINLGKIKEITFELHYGYLFVAFIGLVIFYIGTAMALHYLINSNERNANKIKFKKMLGLQCISGLTKFLPGKVWSYAVQIYVFNRNGLKLSIVIVYSIILLILTITTPLLFALIYFIWNWELFFSYKALLIIIFLLLYSICLFFSPNILNIFIKIINKFKREPINDSFIDRRMIIYSQIIMLAAYSFYVVGASFISYGCGLTISILQSLEIGIICVFSMITGFLILLVPGGIGVQESLIYTLIKYKYDFSIALIIPIIFRIIGVAVDVLLGILSLILIKDEIALFYMEKEKGKT
jgi:hypothetical protein